MVPVLEPPGDDADHALVPIRVEQAERVGIGVGGVDRAGVERGERLFLHRRLDVAALAVQPVELGGERQRRRIGLGEQATDADRHVGEPAGGIEAGTGDETQVVARRPARIAPRGGEQRAHAGLRAAGADAREPLRDERPVEPVEAHDVGHGAQRDQVEQRAEVRLRALGEAIRAPAAPRGWPAARRT